MLAALVNTPRDYAWGSTTLIAALQGREPSGRPEAEVWFGDHPGSLARIADGSGRTLDQWLGESGSPRLPFLLKLLAAGGPLSIQVHPSKSEAESGFAREDSAGIPRDAGARNYRDDNHKPELIVALSDTFRALAGLRDVAETQRLVAALGDGDGPAAVSLRLERDSLADVVAWLLSGDAQPEIDDTIEAIRRTESIEFADELVALREVAYAYPGDPGVVVALLMNYVTLRAGEALYVRAGVLHAYLEGLGVEIMAASDNVLRGGLTPKHIDVDELVGVLDARPETAPLLAPDEIAPGVERFAPPVSDFGLLRIRPGDEGAAVDIAGPAIVLATAGTITVTGGASGDRLVLNPGSALVASADEGSLVVAGRGEAFVAQRGFAPRDTPRNRQEG